MAAPFRNVLQKVTTVVFACSHRMHIAKITKPMYPLPHNCRYCCAVDVRPWQLMSGVCVERYPIVSQPLTDIEEEYQEMCSAVELESSVLSDHEIQVKKDRERIERRKEGDLDDDIGEDGDILTALDLEDLATEKLNEFQAASTKTEADFSNDTTSTERKLSDKLVLLVKEKIGEDMVWMLPQGHRKSGETMREAAERVLNSCTEENRMKVKFFGNAPVGFYKYKYPKEVQERMGSQGVKVFFFKAILLQGDYKSRADTGILEHKWLTREELDSHLHKGYSDCLKKFILPVSW